MRHAETFFVLTGVAGARTVPFSIPQFVSQSHVRYGSNKIHVVISKAVFGQATDAFILEFKIQDGTQESGWAPFDSIIIPRDTLFHAESLVVPFNAQFRFDIFAGVIPNTYTIAIHF